MKFISQLNNEAMNCVLVMYVFEGKWRQSEPNIKKKNYAECPLENGT